MHDIAPCNRDGGVSPWERWSSPGVNQGWPGGANEKARLGRALFAFIGRQSRGTETVDPIDFVSLDSLNSLRYFRLDHTTNPRLKIWLGFGFLFVVRVFK
jgi:hypothetical protein